MTGASGSPSASVHGRVVKIGAPVDVRALGPRRRPDGPGAPALARLLERAHRRLADEHVEAIARLEARRAARRQRLLVAHEHVDERVARQPEVAHAHADRRVALDERHLDDVGAELADLPDLDERGAQRRLARQRAELARDPGERRALQQRRDEHREERDVEELHGARDALDDRERREHDRHRAAQPRPAEHDPLGRVAAARTPSRPSPRAAARRRRARARRAVPFSAMSTRSDGKTSRPSAKNIVSWASQARPSWNAATVWRAGSAVDPIARPGEVDREEARAVQHVGGAERERDDRQRRDRVQAAGREVGAAERLHREPADRRADDRADPELLDEAAGPCRARRSRAGGSTR